jgi:hypothetical protein
VGDIRAVVQPPGYQARAGKIGNAAGTMQMRPPVPRSTTDESAPGEHMPIGQGTAPKSEPRLGELRCCVSKRW